MSHTKVHAAPTLLAQQQEVIPPTPLQQFCGCCPWFAGVGDSRFSTLQSQAQTFNGDFAKLVVLVRMIVDAIDACPKKMPGLDAQAAITVQQTALRLMLAEASNFDSRCLSAEAEMSQAHQRVVHANKELSHAKSQLQAAHAKLLEFNEALQMEKQKNQGLTKCVADMIRSKDSGSCHVHGVSAATLGSPVPAEQMPRRRSRARSLASLQLVPLQSLQSSAIHLKPLGDACSCRGGRPAPDLWDGRSRAQVPPSIEQIMRLVRQATTIQRYFRGYRQRKQFMQMAVGILRKHVQVPRHSSLRLADLPLQLHGA